MGIKMKIKFATCGTIMLLTGLMILLLLTGCGNFAGNGSETTGLPTAEPTASETGAAEPTVTETVVTQAFGTDAAQTVPLMVSKDQLAGEVVFSADTGVYEDSFKLTLTYVNTEGTEQKTGNDIHIYYTTDGNDPATCGQAFLYIGAIEISERNEEERVVSAVDPLLYDAANTEVNKTKDGYVSTLEDYDSAEVDQCCVIRAVAVSASGAATKTKTNTYFIGTMEEHVQGVTKSSEAAGSSLAVISITVNFNDLFDYENGIYVKGKTFDEALAEFLNGTERLKNDTGRKLAANYNQRGKAWERTAHIDFIESNGTVTECVLQQDCGIRIQGNYSRSDLQKGFRLYARSDYGENNFNYTVFGESFTNDAQEVMDKFKVLTLRNGGNCAFTTKYSDTYWQSLVKDMAVETQESRPCVVYLNGEYWGLYILQEDYNDDYFEDTHGVEKEDVIVYKGDAETYEIGYKLDEGEIPEGETVDYYFRELIEFFNSHDNLESNDDYEAFEKLVDVESALDYYAVELWINNKWDWPGKNWSMWRTIKVDKNNPYADGRFRFCFYDLEFGGVSGEGDASTNTIKEDNYKTYGMLDMNTNNPSVLVYTYLMTNEGFRERFAKRITGLAKGNFEQTKAFAKLEEFQNIYSPLYPQFFARYPGTGSAMNSNNGSYASAKCIRSFLEKRLNYIQNMLDYVDSHYGTE